jgi:hypothetical protein
MLSRSSFDHGSQAVLETLDVLANSNLNGLRVALDLADGQQFDAKSLGRYLLLRDIYRGKGIESFDTLAASYLLARHGTFDALLGVHSASLTLMFAVPMTRFALKSLESEVKQAADKVRLSNVKALEDDDVTPAAALFEVPTTIGLSDDSNRNPNTIHHSASMTYTDTGHTHHTQRTV